MTFSTTTGFKERSGQLKRRLRQMRQKMTVSKHVVFIASNKTSDPKNYLVRCAGKIASNTIAYLKNIPSRQKLDGKDWLQS